MLVRDRTVQPSFDELGQPLIDVTFVVIDLETTGAAPATCAITEIGAVKVKGGQTLASFHTLVNPGVAIPPAITYLTGITETMVGPAPRVGEVLPALLEFLGDAVIVGHNIRFDISFLDAALAGHGYGKLANRAVDTCALARRLVREEVRDCKLDTLCRHFRTATRPSHRALRDAQATVDLLHCLLERAAAYGVLALEDLAELPTIGGHPQADKLRLTRALPQAPGVYLFKDAGGRVLYVGKSVNLRQRVRSYFSGDDRRKVGPLLRELASIDYLRCANELEAGAQEIRHIHALRPRYNRQATQWEQYRYVELTVGEAWPRLAVVRRATRPSSVYLGPVSSTRSAHAIVEAIHTVLPLRRCPARLGRQPAGGRPPCTPAQLGVAVCPCSGSCDHGAYRQIVDRAVAGLTTDPHLLLAPLAARIARLADARRFEEAALTRDRAATLSRALLRQHRHQALIDAGRLVLSSASLGGAVIEGGRLLAAWGPGDPPPLAPSVEAGAASPTLGLRPAPGGDPLDGSPPDNLLDLPPQTWRLPVPSEAVDELLWLIAWLDRHQHGVEVTGGFLQWPGELPRFEPRPAARLAPPLAS